MPFATWTMLDWLTSALFAAVILHTVMDWFWGRSQAGTVVATGRVGLPWVRLGMAAALVLALAEAPGNIRLWRSVADLRVWLMWLFLMAVLLPAIMGRSAVCENGIIFCEGFAPWDQIGSAIWNQRGQLVIRMRTRFPQVLTFDLLPRDRDAVERLVAARVAPLASAATATATKTTSENV